MNYITTEYIHKSHNVYPAKYRRVIFNDKVDKVLIQTYKEISKRYEINIIEIGTDREHVIFLIQSVPMLDLTQIVKAIKSITAKEIYRLCPLAKKKLLRGNIWRERYIVSTVRRKKWQ